MGVYFLLLLTHAPGKGGFAWLAIMITAAIMTRDLILDALSPRKVDPAPSTAPVSKALRLICSHLVKKGQGDEMDRET